ncbi:ATP phosphoribosyltransferase, chloroplastic-like [Magnolia sinica]|uniref:ATP phosphoribosyltransferase, chloroplastic-like n=1 Tax=Magnolia sinica TaxID=86752 RepID=UPI00265AC169|nr:ATP phosphoribosyltransferase, chloroplastic-like [Magnolia sinica]
MAYSQALAQNYHFSAPSSSISYSSSRISPKPAVISCRSAATPLTLLTGNIERSESDRSTVRLGLPSKGRLGTGTLDLLTNCQLSVRQLNPEQYVAHIPEISNLEVWFQRPKDIVRRLLSGDVDIGIVGFDTFCEYGQVLHFGLEPGALPLCVLVLGSHNC